LNFRTSRHFRVTGNIKINGEKVSADELGAYVGFVPQDDLFIGTLTVFEHLKFMVILNIQIKKYIHASTYNSIFKGYPKFYFIKLILLN